MSEFLHTMVRITDPDASRRFYDAALGVLGVPVGGSGEGFFWADELFVSTAGSEAAQGELTGRHHLAFQARDRAMVDAFHAAAVAAGGRDNGAPGERPYHPGYYAAFVLDPDGNNIEAVSNSPGPVRHSSRGCPLPLQGKPPCPAPSACTAF